MAPASQPFLSPLLSSCPRLLDFLSNNAATCVAVQTRTYLDAFCPKHKLGDKARYISLVVHPLDHMLQKRFHGCFTVIHDSLAQERMLKEHENQARPNLGLVGGWIGERQRHKENHIKLASRDDLLIQHNAKLSYKIHCHELR